MIIKNVLFCSIIFQLLSGCAAIHNKLLPTVMYVEGENIRITMPGDNPPGDYTLETISGEVIARTKYTQHVTSRGHLARGSFWFRTQHRQISTNAAQSCMQIRKPDNTLLSLRSGILSSSTKFKIPVMEFSVLRNYAIPAIKRNIALINNAKKQRQQLEQKLASQPIYTNGQCVAPDPGPKPANVCRNRFEADKMYEEYCVASNFACAVGGTAMVSLLSNNTPDTKQDFQNVLTLFTQNACSLVANRAYNQATSMWSIVRSLAVTVTVDSIYDSLVTDNPDIGDKLIKDVIAGTINYHLCLHDSYQTCSRNRDRWMSRANKIQRQCLQLKRQFDDVSYLLKRNEHKLPGMENKLNTFQTRLEEIRQGGTRRGRLNQGVDGC